MRRILLAALMLGLAIQTGQAQNRAPGPPWTCVVDNINDAWTLCITTPEQGMRRYITDVVAQSTTTTQDVFQIGFDVTANCGGDPSADQLYPPIDSATRFVAPASTARPLMARPATPMVVPPGANLCVLGGATSTVTVQLFGYSGG